MKKGVVFDDIVQLGINIKQTEIFKILKNIFLKSEDFLNERITIEIEFNLKILNLQL